MLVIGISPENHRSIPIMCSNYGWKSLFRAWNQDKHSIFHSSQFLESLPTTSTEKVTCSVFTLSLFLVLVLLCMSFLILLLTSLEVSLYKSIRQIWLYAMIWFKCSFNGTHGKLSCHSSAVQDTWDESWAVWIIQLLNCSLECKCVPLEIFLIQHLLHKRPWCCLRVTKLCVVERDILTIEILLL